jgi:hypothetical protein
MAGAGKSKACKPWQHPKMNMVLPSKGWSTNTHKPAPSHNVAAASTLVPSDRGDRTLLPSSGEPYVGLSHRRNFGTTLSDSEKGRRFILQVPS